MHQYQQLVRHVLATGTRKENRTGVDTISTFGHYYEHDLKEGFPLLTTKKIAWKNIVIELLWFLSGSNRSGFLERHNCGFWRPWYNKHKNPLDEVYGNPEGDTTVNAAYGPAWRKFEYPGYRESETGLGYDGPCTGWFDQIDWVVRRLKEKPMDRAMVVSAWQPHIATRPPSANAYWAPCHCMWILNVQNEEDFGDLDTPQARFERAAWMSKRFVAPGSAIQAVPETPKAIRQRLCLHLTQRSCDVALGVPYNLASYALLCSILARFGGMEPGIFGHTLVDAHVYTAKPDGSKAEFDHIPGLLEQLDRKPGPLPKLVIADDIRDLADVERLLKPEVTTEEIMSKFVLEGYDPAPAIPFKVAV